MNKTINLKYGLKITIQDILYYNLSNQNSLKILFLKNLTNKNIFTLLALSFLPKISHRFHAE